MRLFLPLGVMFLAALLLGGVALHAFTGQWLEKNEPAAKSTKAAADALNSALASSDNPTQVLDAFVQGLGRSEAIRFHPAGTSPRVPRIGASFPVTLEGKHAGDIVLAPDIPADVVEKWVGFLAIVCSGIALILLTGGIAYVAAGSTLGPLQALSDGLTRMRQGHYDRLIPPSGPPEIRRSCEEANELARTLDTLSRDNRSLLRKMVSLQDDERTDIARELHDELGPLLFGIRANAVAVLESIPAAEERFAASIQGILQSVEALQQANRRILDHLRPHYIQELGLERSVQTLIKNARSQAPGTRLEAWIDPRLNAVDGLLSQTVYRVIQEGITNALRHARASLLTVEAGIDGGELTIEISDNGIGFPADVRFGRGLTGMHERVRALSGTFELSREDGRTLVRCRLPRSEAAQGNSPSAPGVRA